MASKNDPRESRLPLDDPNWFSLDPHESPHARAGEDLPEIVKFFGHKVEFTDPLTQRHGERRFPVDVGEHYLQGLGFLERGDREAAERAFRLVVDEASESESVEVLRFGSQAAFQVAFGGPEENYPEDRGNRQFVEKFRDMHKRADIVQHTRSQAESATTLATLRWHVEISPSEESETESTQEVDSRRRELRENKMLLYTSRYKDEIEARLSRLLRLHMGPSVEVFGLDVRRGSIDILATVGTIGGFVVAYGAFRDGLFRIMQDVRSVIVSIAKRVEGLDPNELNIDGSWIPGDDLPRPKASTESLPTTPPTAQIQKQSIDYSNLTIGYLILSHAILLMVMGIILWRTIL